MIRSPVLVSSTARDGCASWRIRAWSKITAASSVRFAFAAVVLGDLVDDPASCVEDPAPAPQAYPHGRDHRLNHSRGPAPRDGADDPGPGRHRQLSPGHWEFEGVDLGIVTRP
jgi:hypothetical protein